MTRLTNLLRAAAVVAALLLPAALWAQSDVVQAARTQRQKDAQKAETRKPHVWTNDDLPKATEATVSVASTTQPAPPPSEGKPAQAAAAEGGPAAAGQGAAAKPPLDVKTAEDNVKKAQEVVDNTKKTIGILQVRAINETGERQQGDLDMLQHAQGQLPGYQAQLEQAQKDLADAQKAQQQGQPGQAGAQPAPPPPPPPQL